MNIFFAYIYFSRSYPKKTFDIVDGETYLRGIEVDTDKQINS